MRKKGLKTVNSSSKNMRFLKCVDALRDLPA